MIAPHINFSDQLVSLLAPLEEENNQKIKLIIHAGTPKTGTTSLQTYLEKKQRKLRGLGILYPHNLKKLNNPSAPKHQWFEKNLTSAHVDFFLENFKNVISQIKNDTHTIILSSEGIYNYWWDFSAESKLLLGELNKLFDTQVWVWFREPLAFIESYYKQCIRNPRVEGNSCYGQDFSFAQMLEIDWFAKHLDYQGFVNECQSVFGLDSVRAFEYQGDVVQQVIHKLGLSTPYDNPTPRQNKSVNNTTTSLLRTINKINLKAKDKDLLVSHLKEINQIFERYQSEPLIDAVSKTKVVKLSTPIQVFNS